MYIREDETPRYDRSDRPGPYDTLLEAEVQSELHLTHRDLG